MSHPPRLTPRRNVEPVEVGALAVAVAEEAVPAAAAAVAVVDETWSEKSPSFKSPVDTGASEPADAVDSAKLKLPVNITASPVAVISPAVTTAAPGMTVPPLSGFARKAVTQTVSITVTVDVPARGRRTGPAIAGFDNSKARRAETVEKEYMVCGCEAIHIEEKGCFETRWEEWPLFSPEELWGMPQ